MSKDHAFIVLIAVILLSSLILAVNRVAGAIERLPPTKVYVCVNDDPCHPDPDPDTSPWEDAVSARVIEGDEKPCTIEHPKRTYAHPAHVWLSHRTLPGKIVSYRCLGILKEDHDMTTTQPALRHASEEYADIAARGTILRVQVGSGVHGTGLVGQDDRDEMGICLEPPEYVVGLRRFEQYEHRTAWVRGENARSRPEDLDLVVYSARKWMRLALAGNPTVLLPLFVPLDEIVESTARGHELRANAHQFVTRSAGRRFLGYMNGQREGMLGIRAKHTNRPELVEVHGYDTKYAGHMIRLGLQGIELMTTGRISVPIPEDDRRSIINIKLGQWSEQAVLAWADDLTAGLEALVITSDLPEEPDYAWANQWLLDAYTEHWRER